MVRLLGGGGGGGGGGGRLLLFFKIFFLLLFPLRPLRRLVFQSSGCPQNLYFEVNLAP